MTGEGYAAGARDGVLRIQRCSECGHAQFALPGRTAGIGRCRRCRAPEPPWVKVDGVASLVSFTAVLRRPAVSGEVARLAVAGIVELVEGPWVHGAVMADLAALQPGMPMWAAVVMTPLSDLPVPTFWPRD